MPIGEPHEEGCGALAFAESDHDHGATLFFALWIPGAMTDADPDMCADVFARIINEERIRNGGLGREVEVSAIPAPQWLTSETLARLRSATTGGET
jgi:hypothetical protein